MLNTETENIFTTEYSGKSHQVIRSQTKQPSLNNSIVPLQV